MRVLVADLGVFAGSKKGVAVRRREWEAALIRRRIAKLQAALEKERGMARREATQAMAG